MIVLENVSMRFRNRMVFENIHATFHSGYIYGFVGPNGCGKTTLFRCICGLMRPSAGNITVGGKAVGKDVDFAPQTGIIIETPGFLPYYSGLKNLQILASLSGKADNAELGKLMELFGLSGADQKKVRQYSLGMKQRLGIAQAIMENPSYLLLDEPFNGLDRQGMIDIHALLQKWKGEGKTILLASHSSTDIEKACDIVYEMENGKLNRLTECYENTD